MITNNISLLLLSLMCLAPVLHACKNVPVTPAPSLPDDFLNITGIEEKQTRSKREVEKFIDPGNGERCALNPSYNDYTQKYNHIDKNGHWCECQLCHKGKVLKRNCSCDDPLEERVTLCEVVKENQLMKYRNKCETAIDCKTCKYPWTEKSRCSPRGPDRECECVAPDHYLAAHDDCRPNPRRDKGYEPTARDHVVDGEHFTEMQCQPCPEGYYQPNDNSTDKCGKRRVCTVEEGTIFSDAKCLNDTPLPPSVPLYGYFLTMIVAFMAGIVCGYRLHSKIKKFFQGRQDRPRENDDVPKNPDPDAVFVRVHNDPNTVGGVPVDNNNPFAEIGDDVPVDYGNQFEMVPLQS